VTDPQEQLRECRRANVQLFEEKRELKTRVRQLERRLAAEESNSKRFHAMLLAERIARLP